MISRFLSQAKSFLQSEDKLVFTIQFVSFLLLLIFMRLKRVPQGWDTIGVFLVVATVWHKQGRMFVKAFLPFFLLIYTYVIFRRPFTDLDPSQIHVTELIHWERTLFLGHLPAVWLQQWLNPNMFWGHIVRQISNVLYISHFIIPFFVVLFLWNFYRVAYWRFVIGFIITNYVSFLGWTLYPAAPPWWATHFNYLVGNLTVANYSNMSVNFLLSSPDPVAAIPSLHAAYPAYMALFMIHIWGKKAWPIILFPLSIGFAAVYLGHHYVVDILAGYLVAFLAFMIVTKVPAQKQLLSKLINFGKPSQP